MVFKKLQDKRKSVYVLEQIIEAIKSGEYKPGDKLPPERVIAEQTGVSRPSVREALISLQLSGIVERHPGDGTYVRNISDNIISQAIALLESNKPLPEIFELQKMLEIGVAELAVDKATPNDFAAMEEALNKMRRAAVSKDYESWFDGDKEFHRAIADASRNSLIKEEVNSLIDKMNQKTWRGIKRYYLESQEEYLKQSFEEHWQFFQAIKKRDKQAVRQVMEKHFARIEELVFKN